MMAGGSAKELYAYRPDRISFNVTGDVNEPYSDIKYEGQSTNIDPANFLLWKNFNLLDCYDGLERGMSMLEPILKNGDLLNAMIDWNVSLLQNGGNLSGIVAADEGLQDKEYDRAKAELKNEHSGKDNVGKFLLLVGGAKFYQTSNSPKDMDWANGLVLV
jgi:phage portal protein BeeE